MGLDIIQFKIDDFCVDYVQMFGYFGEFQGVFGINDVVVVEWCWWNLDWFGVGCQNYVVCFVGFGVVVFVGNFDFVVGQQFVVIMDGGNIVGFEQVGNIVSQLFNDVVFVFYYFVDVYFDIFGDDVLYFVIVGGFFKFVRNFQQCFGWNVVYVQVGVVQNLVFVIC